MACASVTVVARRRRRATSSATWWSRDSGASSGERFIRSAPVSLPDREVHVPSGFVEPRRRSLRQHPAIRSRPRVARDRITGVRRARAVAGSRHGSIPARSTGRRFTFKRWTPARTPPMHRDLLLCDLQGVSIGETGFEPATARPPAGRIQPPGRGFGGLERPRVARSWPQLRSLCTPDCTPCAGRPCRIEPAAAPAGTGERCHATS